MSSIPLPAGQQIYRKIGGVEYSGVFDGTHYCFMDVQYKTPSAVAMAMANHHYKDTKPHYTNGWNVMYIKKISKVGDDCTIIDYIYLTNLRPVIPTRPRKPKAEPKPKEEPKPKGEPKQWEHSAHKDIYPEKAETNAALAVLGLTRDIFSTSTPEDIRKAVRKAYPAMALRYHPDKGAGNEEMMMRINAAYDVLYQFHA